ncbi:PilZ domain-containing protein [Actinoplanes solisilvae]|uniref:PilZ domain-containing protein n=1 Tax=Actinoplanes solisilvae TaxID=2486853 RepID=UPI000FDC2AC2|nr:PilZ domain-containing protein [Actinoplanes solisilvae]
MIETTGSEAVSGSAREAARKLPDVDSPVHLLVAGESRPSRVVSAGDGTVTVTAPADGPVPAAGEDIDVYWAVPGSRIVLPCRLTEISGETPGRWTLTPTAAARHDDRRRSARGGALTTVDLHAERDGATAKAALIDISEGGLRCWIDDGSLPVTAGDPVRIGVRLGTGEARLNALVHSVRELPRSYSGQHIVLTFEAEHETATLIQRYVIAGETGERRQATTS